AGGLIGLVAGVFGVIAAVVTLMVGGLGSAMDSVMNLRSGIGVVVNLGFMGLAASFCTMVFGALSIGARGVGAGAGLVASSLVGVVAGGTFVAVCMILALIGGVLATVGGWRADPATTTSARKIAVLFAYLGSAAICITFFVSVKALQEAVVAGVSSPALPKPVAAILPQQRQLPLATAVPDAR